MRTDLPDGAALLREHGLQVTVQRLAVLRAVSVRPHSPADELHAIVTAELGTISKQAVYDALAATHSGHRPQYTTSASSISKPESSAAVRHGVSPTAQSTSAVRPHVRQSRWWWLSPARVS